MIQVGAQVLH